MNLDDPRFRILSRLANTIYVILIRRGTAKLDLVVEPGVNQVYRVQNKLIAEKVAADIQRESGYKTMACTFKDAWDLLIKEWGGPEKLEESLMKRIFDKRDEMKNFKPKYKIGGN